MKKPSDKDLAACLLARYVQSIVEMMNVMGVEAMVSMLRKNADDLEQNRDLLETARARKPRRVGIA